MSAPRGLGDLVCGELRACGAEGVRERSGGAACQGSLETAYRACLWSRTSNRVFLVIAQLDAPDDAALYAGLRALDWGAHLGPDATLACDFTGRHPQLRHTHFGALRVKDAIVDALRERTGARPRIDPVRPDVRVHVHARDTRVTVSIDLSGESLHRRGYRSESGEAPLAENVAAGMLLRAGWPALAAAGAPLLDPLCGSGTIVIEAALIASQRAPGLARTHYGFTGWAGHDAALWERLVEEARGQIRAEPACVLLGRDRDAHAVTLARANAARAGVTAWVQFEPGLLREARPRGERPGLVCTNPPWGVRLEDRESARATHRELGELLREHFAGWEAAVITGAPELGRELGLRAHRTHALWNGGIECRLLRLRIEPGSLRAPGTLGRPAPDVRESPGARMFANRLAKNVKRLKAWARRAQVSCYRLYDADMPEYAFAIDLYQTLPEGLGWLLVQEYEAPSEIEEDAVRRRRREALASLAEVTGVAPERIRVRTRRRGRGGERYGKLAQEAVFHQVEEAGLRFEVNFEDYLDTGLFLDHRLTRARLRAAAAGRRFLNLFCYTGSATVYAAAGGARSTTSVDLSRTYLDWAQRNLAANGFAGSAHQLIQADCLEWLAAAPGPGERYELVFLDPPTFSNSKRMSGVLDVQRDHPQLLAGCARRLAPGGLIVFSTNAQRFRLDPVLESDFEVSDISAATLPQDFARNPRIHRCFELRRRAR